MSLQAIWDAVARQSALVEGIQGAYGTAVGGQGASVRGYPEKVYTGPVAIVDYSGTEIDHGLGQRDLRHEFEVAIWVPIGNAGRESAVGVLAPMLSRFLTAFDQNVKLFGTAEQAHVIGSGPFEDATDDDGATFLVQRITVFATEHIIGSYGLGPSS